MKIQPAWPMIVLVGSLLLFLSWSSASSQNEKPTVSSTTEPYAGFHDFEVSGTKKVTTASYKRYTVTTELTNAQSRETPPKKWRAYTYISYKDLHGALLKWGLAAKDVGLGKIKVAIHKALLWHDPTGIENYIACDDAEYTNGHRYHQRVLERDTVNPKNLFHTVVGGFSLRSERDQNGAILHQDYWQFKAGKGRFTRVRWVKDTTGCDNANFPLQLLKEKPLFARS